MSKQLESDLDLLLEDGSPWKIPYNGLNIFFVQFVKDIYTPTTIFTTNSQLYCHPNEYYCLTNICFRVTELEGEELNNTYENLLKANAFINDRQNDKTLSGIIYKLLGRYQSIREFCDFIHGDGDDLRYNVFTSYRVAKYIFDDFIEIFSKSKENYNFKDLTSSNNLKNPHIRKAHFREQPYGKERAFRKTIWINEAQVNTNLRNI